MSNDEELRRAFAELHRSTAERAPGFRGLWRRAEQMRRRRSALRFRLAAAAAAAVAVAALVFFAFLRPQAPGTGPEESALARDLSRWSAPLDFLLLTPGEELWSAPLDLTLALPGPDPDTMEEIL